MSIDINFCMHTDVSSADLLASYRDVLATLSAEPDAVLGFEGRISPESNEILKDALGFEATAELQFRLRKDTSTDLQMQLILEGTLRLLERHPGDAALLHNGEFVYFVRHGDVLTINAEDESDATWPSERLALIRGPYVRKVIPVL